MKVVSPGFQEDTANLTMERFRIWVITVIFGLLQVIVKERTSRYCSIIRHGYTELYLYQQTLILYAVLRILKDLELRNKGRENF